MSVDPYKITLSPRQTEAWELLTEKNGVTEVFMGGAAGPGKSFLGCLWQIHNRVTYPGTRGAICRKTRKSLYDTTYETFKKVAQLWGLEEGVDWKHNDQKSRVTFDNGSQIFLIEMSRKSSDTDLHKFGSLELTDLFVDEAPEIDKKAFEIISSRVREQLINGEPKVLAVGNPANNWAKRRWISNKEGDAVELKPWQAVVRARLSDNPDPEFRRIYEQQLSKLSAYDRARLLYGDWDVVENEAPFFQNFKRERFLVDSLPIWKNEPIWISFDFNYDPTVCIVGQKRIGKGLRILNEHVVKGGTEALCREIKRWGYHKRPAALYVAGDFSGNARKTSAKQTDFQIIAKEFNLPTSFFKNTRTPNKDHEYSRNLCEYVLANVPLEIDRNRCLQLVSDLEIAQVKQSNEGKIQLRKDRDVFKMDLADAFRYLVDAWYPGGISDVDKFTRSL